MKAETVLAKLYEMRRDFEDEPESVEYQALNHAFCFMSYKINELQAYLAECGENAKRPAPDEE